MPFAVSGKHLQALNCIRKNLCIQVFITQNCTNSSNIMHQNKPLSNLNLKAKQATLHLVACESRPETGPMTTWAKSCKKGRFGKLWMHIMDVMPAAPAMSFPSHSKPMAMNTQPAARIWQWKSTERNIQHAYAQQIVLAKSDKWFIRSKMWVLAEISHKFSSIYGQKKQGFA